MMPEPIYQDTDKKIIVEYIQIHARENGYCSVKYGVNKGPVNKKWEGFPDHGWTDHEWAFVQSVAALCSKTGEFISIRDKYDNDFNIQLNPDHKKGYFHKHPTQEKIFIALLSAMASLIVGIVLLQYKERKQNLIDSKQDSTISLQNERLTNLQVYLRDSLAHPKIDTGVNNK